MKNISVLLFVLSLTLTSFGQNDSFVNAALEANKPEIAIVKLRNFSFKRFELYVPGIKFSKEAVRFGTNTFHMKNGQILMFLHEGKNYPLLTADLSDDAKLKYNLRKLVKQRMKDLNLN